MQQNSREPNRLGPGREGSYRCSNSRMLNIGSTELSWIANVKWGGASRFFRCFFFFPEVRFCQFRFSVRVWAGKTVGDLKPTGWSLLKSSVQLFWVPLQGAMIHWWKIDLTEDDVVAFGENTLEGMVVLCDTYSLIKSEHIRVHTYPEPCVFYFVGFETSQKRFHTFEYLYIHIYPYNTLYTLIFWGGMSFCSSP